jgi:hypothetical protein
MADAGEWPGLMYLQAQFLFQFPAQCLQYSFTRFQLAPRKFPEATLMGVFMTPRDQYPVLVIDDHSNSDMNETGFGQGKTSISFGIRH